jgi:hypothetical protein
MKRFLLFVSVFFISGLFAVNAADMITLKDGKVIEAKIMEVHPAEIRYKRADNLNGPMVIIPKDSVLSIRYENGVLEIINESPATGQGGQTIGVGSSGGPQLGTPTPLQVILNALPAIPITGNNLKFQFGGDKWISTVNGENFSAGTIELEHTDDGSILTLKQTHIWPGTAGKTAGRVASRVPGGGAVGGALNVAGNIAGAVGPIEASGPVIILEYKAGPPAKLSYLKNASERNTTVAAAPSDTTKKVTPPADSDYRDFSVGERWGTFYLNNLIPGLGSFYIMHDTAGGRAQLSIFLSGLGLFGVLGIIGSSSGIPEVSVAGYGIFSGAIITSFILNIVRSSSYHKAYPKTASIIDPSAWNIAVLPGKDGIEQVALSYTLRF